MASLQGTEGASGHHAKLLAKPAERAAQTRWMRVSLDRVGASMACLTASDGGGGMLQTLAVVAQDPDALQDDWARLAEAITETSRGVAVCVDGNAWLRRLFQERETITGPAYTLARGGLSDGLVSAFRDSTHLRYVLAVPLVIQSRVWGLVVWFDDHPFGAERTSEAALIAEHIRMAWENCRLRVLAGLRRRRQRIFQTGMMRAEDRLRRDLAEALHGRVQTRLLVAAERIQAAAASLGDGRPDIARELGLVRDILEEMREEEIRPLSHQLHPGLLRLGLRAALFGLIRSWEDTVAVRLEVAPEVEALDDPLENRLSETRRLTLYRVAEEAISNAVRHGGAARVDLALRTERNLLILTVADDGRGVDPARLRPGWGLSSITARLNWSDGGFKLSSNPGRGAVLTAWMPIPEPEKLSFRPTRRLRSRR